MDSALGHKARKLAATCPLCRLLLDGVQNKDYLCELSHTVVHRGPFATRWPGAVQVTSKRHLSDPSQLKYPHFIHSQSELYAIEAAVRSVTAAHHMNVVKFGNVVGHLHWHLIPRFESEKFTQKTPWELEGLNQKELFHTIPTAPADQLYEEISEQLKANLKQLQPPYFATAFFIRPQMNSARAPFFLESLEAQWARIRAKPTEYECFLMQRNYLDYAWDTFGGEIDSGETPRQALEREIQEELGWQLAASIEVTRQWNNGMVRGFVYLCVPDAQQLMQDNPHRVACDEVKQARWVPLDELIRNQQSVYSPRLAGRARALVQGSPDFSID
jgi:diadenosine tetraphosphate (Ap4A) HIT family hydrolase/8-oxo-dGTP pyrophosphatase MutT (NUDIX family)